MFPHCIKVVLFRTRGMLLSAIIVHNLIAVHIRGHFSFYIDQLGCCILIENRIFAYSRFCLDVNNYMT